MPNYIRPARRAADVFFSVCLADRQSTALLDYLDVLRQAVRVTQKDRPFGILAWVVLPDHMHAIWRLPEGDPNYSQRWGRIKARFSRDACRAGLVPPCALGGGTSPALRKGETGIWQRRFWEHHIRDEADLQAHLRYCWWNPVRHGLVEHPTDWVPSSIHRDIRQGRADPACLGLEPRGRFGEAA